MSRPRMLKASRVRPPLLDRQGVGSRADAARHVQRTCSKKELVHAISRAIIGEVLEPEQFTQCHPELSNQNAV